MDKIPQEDYDKAIGQFRLQLNDVFKPFRFYGQHEFIPAAIEEVTELAVKLSMRLRRKDIPIILDKIRNPRYD